MAHVPNHIKVNTAVDRLSPAARVALRNNVLDALDMLTAAGLTDASATVRELGYVRRAIDLTDVVRSRQHAARAGKVSDPGGPNALQETDELTTARDAARRALRAGDVTRVLATLDERIQK